MSGFSPSWLALRESSDARARSTTLTQAAADRLANRQELRVIDLACGTGSNVRYLRRHLAATARIIRWLLVDNDPALLSDAAAQLRDDDVETRALDLNLALEGAAGALFAGRDLVTASALLDLVSALWLDALARRCADVGVVVLFALTYDGRMRCLPAEPEDELVRELVNRHQRGDKGFGAALGPDASEAAASAFTRVGYQTQRERSDWVLADDVPQLQRELIEGWTQAAEEIEPERATTLRDWKARRLAHVRDGRSRLVVGHEDLLAWPS
jgi:hypothetical protein